MRFMFLIYEDPAMSAGFTDADWAQMGRDRGAFAGAASQAGVMVDGWPLDRAKGNATVSVRD